MATLAINSVMHKDFSVERLYDMFMSSLSKSRLLVWIMFLLCSLVGVGLAWNLAAIRLMQPVTVRYKTLKMCEPTKGPMFETRSIDVYDDGRATSADPMIGYYTSKEKCMADYETLSDSYTRYEHRLPSIDPHLFIWAVVILIFVASAYSASVLFFTPTAPSQSQRFFFGK
jgi:hypothetical protein